MGADFSKFFLSFAQPVVSSEVEENGEAFAVCVRNELFAFGCGRFHWRKLPDRLLRCQEKSLRDSLTEKIGGRGVIFALDKGRWPEFHLGQPNQ